MSNGNTGSQVASVIHQENDMSKIREIFERAASAIAQASDLAKTVGELQHIVDGLKADVEKLRQNNSFLDEALTNIRRSRDEALAEASELRHKLFETEHERNNAQQEAMLSKQSLERTNSDLTNAKNDRDNAMMEAMQAKDDLEKAQAQLKAIKASLGIVEQPKPEPQQVGQDVAHNYPSIAGPGEPPAPATPQWQPTPEPLPAPDHGYGSPEPAEATPTPQPVPRTYEGTPGFTWDKPNFWDNTQGKYYNEV